MGTRVEAYVPLPQMPTHAGLIFTWPFPVFGTGISSYRKSYWPWKRTAFMVSGLETAVANGARIVCRVDKNKSQVQTRDTTAVFTALRFCTAKRSAA